MRIPFALLNILCVSYCLGAPASHEPDINALVKRLAASNDLPGVNGVAKALRLDVTRREVEDSAILDDVSYVKYPGFTSKDGYVVNSITFRLAQKKLASFAIEIEPKPCFNFLSFQETHGQLHPAGALVDTTLRAYDQQLHHGQIYIYATSPDATGRSCIVTLGYSTSNT